MSAIPREFVWRRLHSLTGIWIVLFLILHLVTNAQAALFVGEDGKGFIHSANALEELPFLPVIEVAILAVPLLLHLFYGVRYLRTAKYNSFKGRGSTPSLGYGRNHAYTWERITAWLLIVGVIAHVIHMRFVERPLQSSQEGHSYFFVKLNYDKGLYSLSQRLNFELYGSGDAQVKLSHQEKEWLEIAQKYSFRPGEVLAIAKDFGTAELLMVRDTFKKPSMLILYTLLVLAACFHAFNGLWTALIKWGIILTVDSQRLFLKICNGIMAIVAFLGLAAVWGTYWINLYS